ncbi:ATP-binding protein [Abyssalbus ytuae]|uniref:histidine kinase n=1 Tax=Abyssalbus ytuae TaxID=2926907 RepID=A0A9E6ZX24_9FLAO|nr:ATP-binding protein [Abyssalbus ytuae]UOB19333.1 histidine kinase [Abyssalbus ytuae]
MPTKKLYKSLLTKAVLLFFSSSYTQEKADVAPDKFYKLDSLKHSLSTATDSLEVANLSYEIYLYAKTDLFIQNPDEGKYLMRALKIYENLKEWDLAGKVYIALGGIYYNRHQPAMAMKYWNLAKEQYKKTNNIKRQAVTYNNISCIYINDSTEYGQKQMKAYIDTAIVLSKKANDPLLLASPYDNLGWWYMKKDDLDLAEKYTNLALSIGKDFNRSYSVQAATFQLGMIKSKQGYTEYAIYLIEKSLTYNALRKTDPNYLDALIELSKLYMSIGNYKKALYYQENYQKHKDTLYHTEQAKTLLELEMAYETQKKEQIILSQDNELRLISAKNIFKTKLIWATGISALLFFGSIYLYRSRQFAIKEKHIQEHFLRLLLSSHEEERKRISRELHDSVGQNLMLIKNNVALKSDNETAYMISQVLEEVRVISQALHPAVLDKLGLTTSIKKLISDADKMTDIFFTEKIDSIDNIFPKDHELQIYRIIQEAINNIIKHSQADSACIYVKNATNQVIIKVKDYGVGFDVQDLTQKNTLGVNTLKERSGLVGGKISITSVKGKGADLTLIIAKP